VRACAHERADRLSRCFSRPECKLTEDRPCVLGTRHADFSYCGSHHGSEDWGTSSEDMNKMVASQLLVSECKLPWGARVLWRATRLAVASHSGLAWDVEQSGGTGREIPRTLPRHLGTTGFSPMPRNRRGTGNSAIIWPALADRLAKTASDDSASLHHACCPKSRE